MSAQKVEHQRVECLGLFPMGLMPGAADQLRFCIGQPSGDGLQQVRCEQSVVFASNEKNRHAGRGKRRERDLVGLSRWREASALRALLDLDPAPRAFGVRIAIDLR